MRIRLAWVVFVAVVVSCGACQKPLTTATVIDYGGYRPSYQGFGVTTPGGRGGALVKVTNLNDNGEGSLRAALQPTNCAPRIVVFETSGTIALNSPLLVTCPFLTVAGQTAPSPGITVRNWATYIDTHDVVLQHVRFRRGDPTPDSEDTIYIRNNAWNIVLDHLSISWGTHGLLDVNAWSTAQPHDLAILDTILSEGLKKSSTIPGANVPYGTAMVVMPSGDGTLTIARNLFAHNGNRNPWISAGNRVSGFNNVSYNPKGFEKDEGTGGWWQFLANAQTAGNEAAWAFEVVWVGNIALPGVDTHPDTHPVKIDLNAAQAAAHYQVYLADNSGPYMTAANQWSGVTFQNGASEAAVRIDSMPSWHTAFNYQILPNSEAQAYVLSHAGARPLDRDSVDVRIVTDVLNKTGAAISSPSEVGGYPNLAVNTRPYIVPANSNAIAQGQAFRTNLEMDLETWALAVEPQQVVPPTTTVPPSPITTCPNGFAQQAVAVRDAITLQPLTLYTCAKVSTP